MAASLLSLLLLMLGMFALMMVQADRNRAASREALGGVLQRTAQVEALKAAVLEGAVAMRNVGLYTEVADTQRESARYKATRARAAAALKALREAAADAQTTRLLDELAELDRQLDAPAQEAIAQALAFAPDAAAKIITSKIEPPTSKALARADALSSAERQRADAVRRDDDAAASKARTLVLIGCGLTLAVAAAIGVWITRSITHPIRQAVRAAQQVARGDLRISVQPEGRDETAELLRALQAMAGRLEDMIGQVRNSADSISLASQEVASGNVDLSQRTEEAASHSQATVHTMSEFRSALQDSTSAAASASALASTASDAAQGGGAVVAEVVSTMSRIRDDSRRIAEITGVIDGIAFQTNILALNAAVEAARAGEQGRGFAVVAAEVRNLAQRSASAAREIKGLINTSAQTVDNGAELVAKAGNAMTHIVDSVQQCRVIIEQVSVATSAQGRSVDVAMTAIGYIDDANQRNAALVEQVSAASSSLNAQAGQLRRAIGSFRSSADAIA